jgi:DNA repair exonuclease SbcCD ATPase subunit
MNSINLSALNDADLENLIKEARNCLDKRTEAKQTEAWEKLKEALKEYLKYDTIVIHNYLEEDIEVCIADFQELSLNEEGVICVSD